MDSEKRNQFNFRSLPHYLTSVIRSVSFERFDSRYLLNSSSLPRRRNGISADSYNEIRKLILQAPLPTTILQRVPTKEFSLNDIGVPLAASSYYILTLINECSTLVLFNQDHELCRIDLSRELILVYDLCWSSKLNMFLLAGYSLHTFNPRSHILSTTIEHVALIRGEWIVSIAADNNSIYLLYSSRSPRIECRSLFSLHKIEKQWLKKDFLQKKDFLAQCIRISEWNVLAITIKQNNGEWRIDLYDSMNLFRIYRCCSLGQGVPGMKSCLLMPYNRLWVIINNCSMFEQVILIDEYGRIKAKTYIDKPNGLFNLCLIGNEWIGMSITNKLRLYRIK